MDAIKKKMQAMKLEKDNAMDRADACEQQVLLLSNVAMYVWVYWKMFSAH